MNNKRKRKKKRNDSAVTEMVEQAGKDIKQVLQMCSDVKEVTDIMRREIRNIDLLETKSTIS
jgi:hypothetical protein